MKRLLALLLSALMLACALSVTARAEGDLPFTDIPEDYYARDAIEYMYDTGLMNGTSDTTFSPDLPYTRAMFVTMLGRLEGVDTLKYPGSQFRDVAVGNWATPYINWAAQNGIVNGVGEGMFKPGNIITQEQYCTIVCRYMDTKGLDFPGKEVWKPELTDAYDLSVWAIPSVMNMVCYNLVDLDPDFAFGPKRQMDRVTIARYFTDLHRMLNEGVCPQDTFDPAAQKLNLTGTDIIAITRQAAAYLGNWFYFNSYCDSSQTVTTGYGPYEKVINPFYASKQDIVDQGYRFFLFDVSQQMQEVKNILAQGYDLYLSKPEGLGGFMIDRAHIDANMEDAGYVLTISYYAGRELMSTQETRLFYDSDRWVFTDLIYVDLATIDIDVAWG